MAKRSASMATKTSSSQNKSPRKKKKKKWQNEEKNPNESCLNEFPAVKSAE